jgi:hypothetical protein
MRTANVFKVCSQLNVCSVHSKWSMITWIFPVAGRSVSGIWMGLLTYKIVQFQELTQFSKLKKAYLCNNPLWANCANVLLRMLTQDLCVPHCMQSPRWSFRRLKNMSVNVLDAPFVCDFHSRNISLFGLCDDCKLLCVTGSLCNVMCVAGFSTIPMCMHAAKSISCGSVMRITAARSCDASRCATQCPAAPVIKLPH